jgi:thiamine-phosphate pyrophosphorylase
MHKSHSRTKLCLVVETGPLAAEQTRAAISAAAVAAIVIVPENDGESVATIARPVVELAQRAGVAVLVLADPRLAEALAADGVHLPWSPEVVEKYAEARRLLGSRSIVGADAGGSRHDAMSIGEAGADYVGFSLAGAAGGQDCVAARLDLVAWWSEIFEVPGLAFDVATPREAGALAEVGADFVAVRLEPDWRPSDIASRLAGIAAAIDGRAAVD